MGRARSFKCWCVSFQYSVFSLAYGKIQMGVPAHRDTGFLVGGAENVLELDSGDDSIIL